MHRCEFCKILLSYANVDKIMQNIFIDLQEGYRLPNGSFGCCDGTMAEAEVILARAFRYVSEHFEASRNKPLPLVAVCCGLTGRLALTCGFCRVLHRFAEAGEVPYLN
jgi:hypothetical protein